MSFVPKAQFKGLSTNFKAIASLSPIRMNRLKTMPGEADKIDACNGHECLVSSVFCDNITKFQRNKPALSQN